MATYSIKYENSGATSSGSMEIEVADNLIREYTTIVNAGIGKVLAEAGVLLIQAEDGNLTPQAMLTKGLAVEVE
jgi:hypothetical protein